MVMEYERHVEKDEREMRTRLGLEAKFRRRPPTTTKKKTKKTKMNTALSAKLTRVLKEEEDINSRISSDLPRA